LSQSQYAVQFGVAADGVDALEVVFPSADEPWVIDESVNAVLGAITPQDLVDKTITVFRDGWVVLDGNAWAPLAVSPATSSTINLLANGTMELEHAAGGVPDGWERSGDEKPTRECAPGTSQTNHGGACGFRFRGRRGRLLASLEQTVTGLDGQAGDRLALGAWARARSLPPEAQVKIRVRLGTGDEVSDRFTLKLPTGHFPYKGFADSFVATAPYDTARVQLSFRAKAGWIAFDDLVLIATPAGAAQPAGARRSARSESAREAAAATDETIGQ
jgi:hypothetical protein